MSNFFESLMAWLPELSLARTIDTAIGAFMGAATAALVVGAIAWYRQKKIEKISRTEALNRTLFILLMRMIIVKGYSLALARALKEANDMRLVPPFEVTIDNESFEFENMSWMLESKYRQVLLEVKMVLENYLIFCQLMFSRKHFLLHEVHPKLGNVQLDKKNMISELDRLPQPLKSRFEAYNNQIYAILLGEMPLHRELKRLFGELRNSAINLGYKELISLDSESPLRIIDKDSISFKAYAND